MMKFAFLDGCVQREKDNGWRGRSGHYSHGSGLGALMLASQYIKVEVFMAATRSTYRMSSN
jgi:hypothetical protein